MRKMSVLAGMSLLLFTLMLVPLMSTSAEAKGNPFEALMLAIQELRAELLAEIAAIELLPGPPGEPGPPGSAATAEHLYGRTGTNLGRIMAFDGSVSFIGSFNLNKRSVFINTEMGLLVRSPKLAEQISSAARPKFEPGNSWRVTLDESGRPEWNGHRNGRAVRYGGEPASFLPSFGASLLSIFPATQYF